MLNFIKALYIATRVYWVMSGFILFFVLSQFYPILYPITKVLSFVFIALLLLDSILLFSKKDALLASRNVAERLSNGDENKVEISVRNHYPFSIAIEVIDEIPFQFQVRDFLLKYTLKMNEGKTYQYTLLPTERGEYNFGALLVYVTSPLGLIKRRFSFDADKAVKVYPSFLQMRKYELLAISNRLTEAGIKKIRKISNNNEFEQVREYVQGDDIRTLNWKATARKSQLMVNQYQDEKSQEVYSLIDMGRAMKMPFEEMTLLDYSINASLIISSIAMYKQDKAGLTSFSKNIHQHLTADRRKIQLVKILETLYRQETNYDEADYEKLYSNISSKIKKRSLLLLYTNFESLASLKRQIKTFRAISRKHLLIVIFFKNTEINQIIQEKANNLEGIYVKTIAEKFEHEKRQIVKELKKYGIDSILTEPKNLNVNLINKYLEIKASGLF